MADAERGVSFHLSPGMFKSVLLTFENNSATYKQVGLPFVKL